MKSGLEPPPLSPLLPTLASPVSPRPGSRITQINKRFAAACAAAGLEGRRTTHSGRAGIALVELSARGASAREVQLAGGWKGPATVAGCAAGVGINAVNRLMR